MDGDITDKEFEEVLMPYNDNLDNFVIKYIIPEVFAFQLANSYSRGCLYEEKMEQHYKTMTDVINLFPSIDIVKEPTVEILKIKYNLMITNENPLTLEKWQ